MSIDTTDTTTQAGTPEVAQVDPRALILEVNVRTDAALTPEFIASVKTHGVLTPVLVQRHDDGLYVRAGQRRTLAAIEADLPTIPAYVVGGDTDEARRIIEQMVENDQRRALGDADRIAGFQQLSLLGLSAAQIAKRTATKKDHVTTALTVAASPVATAVTAKYDLTLDQGAVIAEFDDDTDAVKTRTVTATSAPQDFAHTAQRIRDERAEHQAVEALTDELTQAGTSVIDQPAYDNKTIRRLTDLATLDGQARTPLTPEDHATCPGRAAYIARNYHGPVAVHACTDPATNGHVDRYATTAAVASGPMSEDQKAERREVIANNKAWKSAETVRRDWLRTLAARKTAPKDAGTFLAHTLATSADDAAHAASTGHALAHDLLGINPPKSTGYGYYGRHGVTDLIDAASPARAQVIALTLALAGIEHRTGTHTWRNPSADVVRYLRTIAAWGYTLSEVEQTTIDRYDTALTAHQADDPADDHDDDQTDYEDGETYDDQDDQDDAME
jgi:ParB family chromosome partitioning protein